MSDIEQVLADILREGAHCACVEDAVASCHKILKERYPLLKFRWCRILGPRWAHVYGDANDLFADMLRVKLSPEIGLCIENAGEVRREDVARMVDLLKLCFQK